MLKMELWQGLVLGAFQGVAEFLPISSSGHLLILRNLFGLGDVPVLFDILLHLATLLAIFLVFRKRIGGIFVSLYRLALRRNDDSDRANLMLVPTVLVATVVTAVIGFSIEALEMEKIPKFTFFFFIITGLILLFLHFYKGKEREGAYHSGKGSLLVGFFTGAAQGLGVFPGISRSGITISASRLAGLTKEEAGEYSFIIAIPAILGATILDLRDVGNLFDKVTPLVLSVSFLASFVVGMISLLWLLKLLKGGKLYYFSFYLIPLGVLGLLFF